MAGFIDHKIVAADYTGKDMEGFLPTGKYIGAASIHLKQHDKLVKEVVEGRYNALIDELRKQELYCASAYCSTTQQVANSTSGDGVPVLTDTEQYDPNGNFNAVACAYAVPAAGLYRVNAIVGFTVPTASAFTVLINVNDVGTLFRYSGLLNNGWPVQFGGSRDILLTAGKVLQLKLWQNTGGNVILTAGASMLQVQYLHA